MPSETSAPATPDSAAKPAPSPIMSFFPMIVLFVIFYFLLIRPQQKQAKEHKKMLDNLKSGDRIMTQGGILGTVATLRGEIVQVKIADNVKVDVSRSSIAKVLTAAVNGNGELVEEKSS